MRLLSSGHSLVAGAARRYAFCLSLAALWLACSVTLDPTLSPPIVSNELDARPPDEAGDAPRSVLGHGAERIDASAPAMEDSGFADFQAPPTCILVRGPGKEYLFCSQPRNRGDAAVDCSDHGGTLVAIESADENAFLYAQALPYANHNLCLGGTRHHGMPWNLT